METCRATGEGDQEMNKEEPQLSKQELKAWEDVTATEIERRLDAPL